MSSDKKKKKLTSGEGFVIGSNEELSLSLGDILSGKTESSKHTEIKNIEQVTASPSVVQVSRKKQISDIKRIVLQRESAGRGGKTVTMVIIPQNVSVEIELVAKEMRKGLGCGSSIENGRIVLLGDLSDRAKEWLLKKGVKEVIQGN
ncbi:MAG: translation initiation factor [Synergistaceae bacterium]|nr:translation initiation factor [Synergistaceae bacterium]